uniref:Protease n=1 Tax=Mycena chlorophos TaxID=658473 RepID=A0ABQ0L177_MYCCL|nr:protease [Mycena chlorophos]
MGGTLFVMPFLWLFALVYIDDIVIFSKSWEEHLVHLDQVLGAIAKSGITLEPKKCFIGYSSILLLGQKVSRLGLSTHHEKVAAIQELERPKSVHDLQKLMGMVNYFSTYIPYYAFIMKPLFVLLQKGVKWEWKAEHEIAFQKAKDVLTSAPVLGHPIQGQPYRLYTNASDYAIGSSLQQVQPIVVRDLKGTTAYQRLSRAYQLGLPPPKLFTSLVKEISEGKECVKWEKDWEDTTVYAKHVICYWSRTLRSAERNYSATEREALGAKEALIRFQPFIEGEKVVLITDHSTLAWAKSYENMNRRLAAWGGDICGVPWTQNPRMPVPAHDSPLCDDLEAIQQDTEKRERAEKSEEKGERAPAQRAAFAACWWEDHKADLELVLRDSGLRSEDGAPEGTGAAPEEGASAGARAAPQDTGEDVWTLPMGSRGPAEDRDEEWERRAHLLISLAPEVMREFVEGYSGDRHFKGKYVEEAVSAERLLTPSRFQKGQDRLLYFMDVDWQTHLCVPKNMIKTVLEQIHESARETAHTGPQKLLLKLRELFYWPTMNDDAEEIKVDRRKQMGGLRPAHIPSRPFATVSMDLITGLPPSGPNKYTAVLVFQPVHSIFLEKSLVETVVVARNFRDQPSGNT